MTVDDILLSEKYFPAVCVLLGALFGAIIPTIANIFLSVRAQEKETKRKILEMAYNAAIFDYNQKIKSLTDLHIGSQIPPFDSFLFHFIQSINVLIEKEKCSPEEQAYTVCDINRKTKLFIDEWYKNQKNNSYNKNTTE